MKSSMMIWIIFPVVLFMELPYAIPCNISDVDIQKYQRQFEDLVSNGIGMIYINVSSPSFENITLTQKEWNKIIDWIWVTDKYKHVLSYLIDIDVFTLELMRRKVRSLKMNVSIENIENCTRNRIWTSVYEYLFEVHNRSDGYFCHRYFENQDWKEILYSISHVSIGYGFHCFQRNDTSSPLVIKKSPIIYITILIILILIVYYPMIFSPFSREQQNDSPLLVYTKADYPYTPRRLFLYMFFKSGDILHSNNVTRWANKLKNHFGGARLSFLIFIVTGLAHGIKVFYIHKCSDCLPPNAFIYGQIYVFDGRFFYNLTFVSVSFLSLLFLLVVNINIVAFSSKYEDELIIVFPSVEFLRSIPVSCFLEHEEDNQTIVMEIANRLYLMFSLKFWCKLYLLPLIVGEKLRCFVVLKCVFSPIIFLLNVLLFILFSVFPIFNYTHFVYRFLFDKVIHRCSEEAYFPRKCVISVLLLSLKPLASFQILYLLVYSNSIIAGMTSIVQFLVYFVLVAIPHLYSTQLHIFLILTASITYMSKFFLEFFLLYHLLLIKILQIKGEKSIEIDTVDDVVRHCCPVTKEVLFLFAKVLLTSCLLIIMYLTLNELNFLDSENSFDLNAFLMYVFVLLTPGLLEILFFESNADKVERMHEELDERIRNLCGLYEFDESIHENTDGNRQASNDDIKCNFATVMQVALLCCCGCLECPCDEYGHCKCCYTLEENIQNDKRSYTPTDVTCAKLCWQRNERRGYESINSSEMVPQLQFQENDDIIEV